jgi:hypothetical protein
MSFYLAALRLRVANETRVRQFVGILPSGGLLYTNADRQRRWWENEKAAHMGARLLRGAS